MGLWFVFNVLEAKICVTTKLGFNLLMLDEEPLFLFFPRMDHVGINIKGYKLVN
jgi:hypothetical protein